MPSPSDVSLFFIPVNAGADIIGELIADVDAVVVVSDETEDIDIIVDKVVVTLEFTMQETDEDSFNKKLTEVWIGKDVGQRWKVLINIKLTSMQGHVILHLIHGTLFKILNFR